MRPYLLLSISLLVGVTACEFKITPGDTDDEASTGAATTGESDSAGTTTGASGQTSNSGSSVGTVTDPTATATATSTTDATTDATTSTTSASSATTVSTEATTVSTTDPVDPIDPTPCEGEAKPIPGEAIAFLLSQAPPEPDTTGGGTATGGDPPDPNTLQIRLSSQAFTCADPDANLECGTNWAVSITIPPEFQTPGLYHLSGPNVLGIGTETGADEGGGQCSFGGGSFWATFELIDIDAEKVTGRLCHVDAVIPFNAAELEGVFEAPRCP